MSTFLFPCCEIFISNLCISDYNRISENYTRITKWIFYCYVVITNECDNYSLELYNSMIVQINDILVACTYVRTCLLHFFTAWSVTSWYSSGSGQDLCWNMASAMVVTNLVLVLTFFLRLSMMVVWTFSGKGNGRGSGFSWGLFELILVSSLIFFTT